MDTLTDGIWSVVFDDDAVRGVHDFMCVTSRDEPLLTQVRK